MTHTRTLAFGFAVVAMLSTPLLQHSAEAQGRGGSREATGGRGGGGRVAPAPRPGNRVVAGPRRNGRVVLPSRRGGVVIGAYYQPRYYSSFYNGFYDPWFPYGYSRYAGYPGGQFYGPESALRLQVSPRSTEVFVDGYYAGTVDDFDGIFQRLRLESGEYEVTLYLPGYRTVTQRLLLQADRTLRVKHVMEPLGPTDPPEPRPVATGRAAQELAAVGVSDSGAGLDVSFGAIAIRVQPADAVVLVDGERWDGPADDEALVLQIAPGPHRIEVRRDGYRGYAAQIDVRAGQTAPINVSLSRE